MIDSYNKNNKRQYLSDYILLGYNRFRDQNTRRVKKKKKTRRKRHRRVSAQFNGRIQRIEKL